VQQSNANLGSATTLTVDLGDPVGAHDALRIGLTYPDNITVVSIADDLGSTFHSAIVPTSADGFLHEMQIAEDVATGNDAVHVVLSATPSLVEMFVEDYSGVAADNAIDVTAVGTGSSVAMNGVTTPTVTTTGPDEAVLAYASGPGAASDGTGWTALATFDGDLTEGRTLATPGDVTATATITSGPPSGDWIIMLAALRP
jgi:hypothetical protein